MDKLKSIFSDLKSGKKSIGVAIIGIACLILLFVSEFGAEESKDTSSENSTGMSAEEYIENTQKELVNLLEKIDGAGNVSVMITLENCYENVYAKGYSSKEKIGGEDTELEKNEEYIVVSEGSNKEECLVVKVYEPKIKGVAVVAEGGNSAAVKKSITDTVCAVFDISSAKVSVEKMKIQQ